MNSTPSPTNEERAGQRSGTGNVRNQHPDDMPLAVTQPLRAPFRHSAPRTSREAAVRIQSISPSARQRVLEHLVEQGRRGSTDEEAELALGIKPQSYTPRRRELVKLGIVIDSGERRKTEAGRSAVVWVSTHTGNVRV